MITKYSSHAQIEYQKDKNAQEYVYCHCEYQNRYAQSIAIPTPISKKRGISPSIIFATHSPINMTISVAKMLLSSVEGSEVLENTEASGGGAKAGAGAMIITDSPASSVSAMGGTAGIGGASEIGMGYMGVLWRKKNFGACQYRNPKSA